MNIGTMNIDNLIVSITEDEATELVYHLTKKFDWAGTLFYSADIEEYVETRNEDEEETDMVTVEEYMNTCEHCDATDSYNFGQCISCGESK